MSHSLEPPLMASVRALVISPQPFFSVRGTPLSIYYRNLVMAEMGVQIDVLTYGQGEDVEIPGMRIFRIPDFPIFGKIKAGPTFLKAFLDLFMIRDTWKLLKENEYDFVHVHEEAAFFCLPLKRIFHFRLLYDMHSSLPQQLENFNFTSSRLIRKVFQWLEDRALEMSDSVVTICPSLAEHALSKLRSPTKHHLIENSIFEPVSSPQASTNTYRLNREVPNVVYCGTLEHYQGIDILLDEFGLLLQRMPSVKLIIIGGDEEKQARYKDQARELQLEESVQFLGILPQSEAHQIMQDASVLVSPRRVGINTPLKVYQLLASGVPVVATDILAHTQVFSEEVAYLVKPEKDALAQGIFQALTDTAASHRKVEAALRLHESDYSESSYREKVRRLVESVLPPGREEALKVTQEPICSPLG